MNLRLKYTKAGDISYISHLDVVKLMERIFRRARLPIAYSEGFNPHPKMSFGPALGLGVESHCEYIDIELKEEMDPQEALDRLNPVSVQGVEFTRAMELPERPGSIVAFLTHADYEVAVELDDREKLESLELGAERINKEKEILLTRKTKKGNPVSYNLKEYLGEIGMEKTKEGCILRFTVCSGSVKSLNPRVVLDRLLQDIPEEEVFVRISKIRTYHLDEESGEISCPIP